MQVKCGTDVDERRLELLCMNVQRLLRLAISDWYGYLSRLSMTSWQWRYEVPWWVKRVPERLDKDWALNDLRASLDRPGMLARLAMAVDETILSMEREKEQLDNPPNLEKLDSAVKELCSSVGGIDVLGV